MILLSVDNDSDSRYPAAYFQGSTFREAVPKEAEKAVQVLGCSGNLLKSSDGNLYVLMAGHCLKFIDTCFDINIRLHIEEHDQKTFVNGKCREMKINDKEHDIVIFKAELFKDNMRYYPNEDLKYCLEENILPQETPLRVVHFPNFNPDKINAPKATVASAVGDIITKTPRVSENCSIISEPVWCAECRDKQTVQWVNCPLFEGSSGAGLINLKNSCIAGVAHAADPGAKEFAANEKGASMAVMSLFVKKHRKQLDELKIKIGDTSSEESIMDSSNQESQSNSVR